MDRKRIQEISEIRPGCLFAGVALLCLPFLGLGSVFTALSVDAALDQARANAATQRVTVTIRSAEAYETMQTPTGDPSMPLGQRPAPESNRGSRITRGARNPSTPAGSGEYAPVIGFSYERDGREMTSDAYTPVGRTGTRAWAEGVAAAYPPGSTHEAWLPEDPTLPAFLEKSWNAEVYAGVGVGLFCWSFCGMLLAASGGWRWLGRAWLGAVVIAGGVLVVAAWAVWHAMTVVPRAEIPGWLGVVGVGVALSAVLPLLGAVLATRVAHHLAAIGGDAG